MTCSEILQESSAYVDGELEQSKKLLFEEHLETCASCRKMVEELRSMVSACRDLESLEPPPDFHEMVKMKLAQAKRPGLISSFSSRRYAGLLAAAAVLVLVVASSALLPLISFKAGSPQELVSPGGYGIMEATEDAAPQVALDYSEENETKGRMGEGTDLRSTSLSSAESTFDRKIIRRANLQVEVLKDTFGDAQHTLVGLTQSAGGFIQESSVWEAPYGANARFILRVPDGNFLAVVEGLRNLGKVTSENISGEDVTGEYVDVESRLESLKVHEKRLLEILSKAQNVDELLRIESELSRVRGEIESLTGRLKYLGGLVSMATIEVNIASVKELTPSKPTLWEEMIAAFVRTLRALMELATRVVLFLSSAAPVIIVLAAVWYFLRRKR